MKRICLRCGCMTWDEYVDGWRGTYETTIDGCTRIDDEVCGDIILVRCHYCESEKMLDISDLPEEHVKKLLSLPDYKGEERLRLIREWYEGR